MYIFIIGIEQLKSTSKSTKFKLESMKDTITEIIILCSFT